MLDKSYYETWNKNDEYGIKKDVLELIAELERFEKRLKKFLGPNKIKLAGTDSRRSCRDMRDLLKQISQKIQMTKQDYNADYEND